MMRAPEGAHDKRLRHRVATAFSHRRWYARKAEERAAGWDSRFVSLYRVERERAATRCTVGSEHLVGGLVVTDFERPRQRTPVLGGSPACRAPSLEPCAALGRLWPEFPACRVRYCSIHELKPLPTMGTGRGERIATLEAEMRTVRRDVEAIRTKVDAGTSRAFS